MRKLAIYFFIQRESVLGIMAQGPVGLHEGHAPDVVRSPIRAALLHLGHFAGISKSNLPGNMLMKGIQDVATFNRKQELRGKALQHSYLLSAHTNKAAEQTRNPSRDRIFRNRINPGLRLTLCPSQQQLDVILGDQGYMLQGLLHALMASFVGGYARARRSGGKAPVLSKRSTGGPTGGNLLDPITTCICRCTKYGI